MVHFVVEDAERNIYGPVVENNRWKKITNKKLRILYENLGMIAEVERTRFDHVVKINGEGKTDEERIGWKAGRTKKGKKT